MKRFINVIHSEDSLVDGYIGSIKQIQTIGRASAKQSSDRVAAQDNLLFPEKTLSKKHALLEIVPGCELNSLPKVYIHDAGSQHGVVVNNQLLNKNQSVEIFDHQKIGFVTNVKRSVSDLSNVVDAPLDSCKLIFELSISSDSIGFSQIISSEETEGNVEASGSSEEPETIDLTNENKSPGIELIGKSDDAYDVYEQEHDEDFPYEEPVQDDKGQDDVCESNSSNNSEDILTQDKFCFGNYTECEGTLPTGYPICGSILLQREAEEIHNNNETVDNFEKDEDLKLEAKANPTDSSCFSDSDSDSDSDGLHDSEEEGEEIFNYDGEGELNENDEGFSSEEEETLVMEDNFGFDAFDKNALNFNDDAGSIVRKRKFDYDNDSNIDVDVDANEHTEKKVKANASKVKYLTLGAFIGSTLTFGSLVAIGRYASR